jgi:hypothetical protein
MISAADEGIDPADLVAFQHLGAAWEEAASRLARRRDHPSFSPLLLDFSTGITSWDRSVIIFRSMVFGYGITTSVGIVVSWGNRQSS